MHGLLLIDKPAGWTSHDVVAKVRNILKKSAGHKVKVGHTGTLDPLATGLLVLVVGSYCKRAQEFSKLDKVYEVEMKLGETSTTGDEEGEKTTISTHQPPVEDVRHVVEQFTGEIEQIPPAFSALKVGGKRAYQLAREGKDVKLEPRIVTVHSLQMTEYKYPIVRLTAHVSSGTYIRTLVEDIGRRLEAGAYMSSLRRMSVSSFDLADAHAITELTPENIPKALIEVA